MSDLLRRQAATQATLDHFRGKAWSWQDGRTCVHLARYHLRAMGHRPERIPPRITSALAARRAMDRRGWSNVVDLLDAQPGLMRIAPARAMMGDIAAARSEDGIGGILICAGPHKFMGWQQGAAGLVLIEADLNQLDGVWRV